jgi:endonuclease III
MARALLEFYRDMLAGVEVDVDAIRLLLRGIPAAPVDFYVRRVASRFGTKPEELVLAVTTWAAALEPHPEPGKLLPGQPPATYRAFAALVDVGRTRCFRMPYCTSCPIVRWCATAEEGFGG